MKQLIICLLFSWSALAFDVPDFIPNVVDKAGIFDSQQMASLNLKIQETQRTGKIWPAVLVVPTLSSASIEEAAYHTFQKWGLGLKGKDNGVLILVAINDHKMRIEVGRGVEDILTDFQAKMITNNIMKPSFRKNEYFTGIHDALVAIEEVGRGERVTHPNATMGYYGRLFIWALGFLIVPGLMTSLAYRYAKRRGIKIVEKVQETKGFSTYALLVGVLSKIRMVYKLFVFVALSVFFVILPVENSDDVPFFMMMNFLECLFILVALWFALKNSRKMIHEKYYSKVHPSSGSNSSSNPFTYADSSSYASYSSDSSSSSYDSSSGGGESSGGGSSDNW